MFDKWIILKIKATGERIRIYEDDLETILEEYGHSKEDVEIIPISKAKPRELAELIGDEAESANYHEFTSLADELYKGMKKQGMSKEDQLTVLKIFARSVDRLF